MPPKIHVGFEIEYRDGRIVKKRRTLEFALDYMVYGADKNAVRSGKTVRIGDGLKDIGKLFLEYAEGRKIKSIKQLEKQVNKKFGGIKSDTSKIMEYAIKNALDKVKEAKEKGKDKEIAEKIGNTLVELGERTRKLKPGQILALPAEALTEESYAILISEPITRWLDIQRTAKRNAEKTKIIIAGTMGGIMGIIAYIINRIINRKSGGSWTRSTALSIATAMMLGLNPIAALFNTAITHYVLRHADPKTFRGNIAQNFIMGMQIAILIGLGWTIGSIAIAATTPTVDGEPKIGESPLLNIVRFQAKTIAWAILMILVPVLLALIGKMDRIIMLSGTIFAGMQGIAAYAREWRTGLFGKMPAAIWESAILWAYDELDDFKDGFQRMGLIPEEDEGGIFEAIVIPIILGFFNALMGVEDPYRSVIPGSSAFADYVIEGSIGEPWQTILKIVYQIAATVIGGIVASGSLGLGFAVYIIGSVIGQLFLNRVLGCLFGIVG